MVVQWKRDTSQVSCVSRWVGAGPISRLRGKKKTRMVGDNKVNLGHVPEVSVEDTGGDI